MALSGLDIYKLLPKTNCKKCGMPTCLAFAMKLASKQVSLDQCPDVSAESRTALSEASEPPIKLVQVGVGEETKVEIGNETVMFRHEESFYHPSGVAIRVGDDLSAQDLKARIDKINGLKFERVGTKIHVDMIAVNNVSGDAVKFAETVKAVDAESGLPLLLISEDTDSLLAGMKSIPGKRPLVHAATKDNWERLLPVAKEQKCGLCVRAESFDELAELTKKIKDAGFNDLVLDPGTREIGETLQAMTQIRRAALKKNFRQLGYSTVAFALNGEPDFQTIMASTYVAKYAGIVVTDADTPARVMPILTARTNIYTDPRKPITVDPKIYEIGEVTENSPFLITTNFSLTYYTVEGETESSRVPSYILAVDTDGTSVLTAWAADKFVPEPIAAAIKASGIADKVKHRKVIIPGHVAVIAAGLADELGGEWEILIGPKEATGLPTYLKNDWKAS